MERTAKAQWKGTIKEGKGTINAPSGVLSNSPYSHLARFGEGIGTNPEELIGAAHAGCFGMMTSLLLTKAGHKPEQLDTEAKVVLGGVGGLPTITDIHLKINGKVPGIDAATFRKIATEAKEKCPVSRLLTGAKTHLEISFAEEKVIA
ncbi:MAG: OsmC family protein [Flavobacteriales bacterium]|nr:OsmC family protein [Flavobacteriales bacterium]MBP9080144.1 OsmC family protein [Flavobacteriales bacterium]